MIQDNKKIPKKIKDILIQNPHWITNDLDLLNQIIDSENKKNTGNVVDLRDIFLKQTKSKFEKLSKIHTHTITAAYENFLGANNLHRCIIKILEQNKLDELIHILFDDIKNILKCSETALLVSNQYEKFLENPNFFNVANEEIQEITKSAKLTKNSLVKLNTNSQNLCISHYLNKKHKERFIMKFKDLIKQSYEDLKNLNVNVFNVIILTLIVIVLSSALTPIAGIPIGLLGGAYVLKRRDEKQ